MWPLKFRRSSRDSATKRDASINNGSLGREKSVDTYHGNDNHTDSESDEEDVRTFDRIILIPEKTRAKTSEARLKVRRATNHDAERYNLPAGYNLPPGYSTKYWDPTEEPITVLNSVFDANALGRWIYDWTVYRYHGCPLRTVAFTAGELWVLLIELFEKCQRCEKALRWIHTVDETDMIKDFIENGERLKGKLEEVVITGTM